MSRRDSRSRPQPPAPPPSACPCEPARAYAECCGLLHAGKPAASPEELMRSRYSAFVRRDTAYLLLTWHPDTRPPMMDLGDGVRWTGLEVLETTGGSGFHTEGTVAFRANFIHKGTKDAVSEHSRFVRLSGAWVYWGEV